MRTYEDFCNDKELQDNIADVVNKDDFLGSVAEAKSLISSMKCVVPRVKVKYRDKLCFSGQKVEYPDITKFVLRDGKYIPLFTLTDKREGDICFDMYPLIFLGMVEILADESHNGGSEFYNFMASIIEDGVFEDQSKFINTLRLIRSFDRSENDDDWYIARCLRSDFTTDSFNFIKTFYSNMICTSIANQELACKVLLESMNWAYLQSMMWFHGDTSNFVDCKSIIENSHSMTAKFYCKSYFEPKKIGYTVPNSKKKHYITNCRGAGIYAYLILLSAIYNKFGERLSSSTKNIFNCKDDIVSDFQESFKNCLGDDYIGKYYRTGKYRGRDNSIHYSIALQMSKSGDTKTEYTLEDDSTISREEYENMILWRRANKVTCPKLDDKRFRRNYETYYCHTFSIYDSAVQMFVGDDNIYNKFEDYDDFMKRVAGDKLLHEDVAKLIYDKVVSIDNDEEIIEKKKYDDDIQQIKAENAVICQNYEKKIEELNAIIASKTNIIEQLSAEAKEHNSFIQRIYTDDSIEQENEIIDIPLEEKVNFLNDYKIAIVGGFPNLIEKLESLGITNVCHLNDLQCANSTPITADFFCIITKSVSHKVVRLIESRYKNQSSEMMYYNGKNAQALINSCYAFIKEWMEG
jgi:hypothetical protein